MKTVLLFILTILLISVNAQNTEKKTIEVKQLGKHLKNNFLNFKSSSKKIYYFEPNGLISKSIKYGRHHYAYLSVIGLIENYQYDNNVVIEVDTTYYNESDETFNVTIDTLRLDFITRKLSYDSTYNKYDRNQNLIQSANDFNQVKKYEYKHNGLISRITYYYADDKKKLSKKNYLIYRWKNIKRLSKATIDRLNNFILWQHEIGI